MEKPSRSYLVLLTLTATMGGLLFGYDTAVISGTVASLKDFFIDPFNWPETIANSRHGLVVSSALIGCIFGALSGGLISKKLGRKNGLLLAAMLFLISALGSAMPELFFRPVGQADHTFIQAFVVYRIIGGIGVGLASMLSPLYIAEIAPAGIRGKLVSWNQFAIIFGMLVVYFVNYSIARQGEDAWLHQIGWRWMFASEVIPASLFVMLLLLVPETPRFYVMKGSEEKAFNVLSRINGKEIAGKILEEIKTSFISEKGSDSSGNKGKSSKLFSFGATVIVIGIMLAMFQQFIGINVVLYYAPEIFRDMGAKTDASLLSTIYVGIVNLVFTILAIVTVDRFGRRPLMVIGAIIMAVAMISIGFTFFTGMGQVEIGSELVNQFTNRFAAIAAFSLILVYIAGFAISWGPVTWVLLSEIFPNRIRGRALAVATAAMWISNLIISWTFPILNNSSFLVDRFNHGAAYWIYGCVSVIAALFVSRYVPETKKKSLEELEALWK
jgi:SP family xylose:H+ symportor-like MFS transporter